jgi:hypothetical protein
MYINYVFQNIFTGIIFLKSIIYQNLYFVDDTLIMNVDFYYNIIFIIYRILYCHPPSPHFFKFFDFLTGGGG